MFGRNVKCDSCDKTETIQTTLIYHYVLSEHVTLPMSAKPTWCFDCDAICDSEQLLPLEVFSSLLQDLKTDGLDRQELEDRARFLRIELDYEHEFELELTRRETAVQWRSERDEPRCLNCGETNHLPLQTSGQDIPHPGCNGHFRIERSFHGIQSFYWQVDADGRRIESASK